jgi:hypothetical protein
LVFSDHAEILEHGKALFGNLANLFGMGLIPATLQPQLQAAKVFEDGSTLQPLGEPGKGMV